MSSPPVGAKGDPFSAQSSPLRRAVTPTASGAPAGGLLMSSDRYHLPVMAKEVREIFSAVPAGVVIDATAGGGGHSELLAESHAHLRILGLDRDEAAVSEAGHRLAHFGSRAKVLRAPFSSLSEVAAAEGLAEVSGVLFDLGVSSRHFDDAARGFSYRSAGPLDMRMDTRQELTAADLVNGASREELVKILVAGGEDRFPGRIASAIVRGRPFSDTVSLAEAVVAAIPAPARRRGGHPAKRTFQALRMAVNGEISELHAALGCAIDLLAAGGRIVVISYHSGEDRIVKAGLAARSGGSCRCPAGLPCVCGAPRDLRLGRKGALKPGAEEIAANPRAASARLRWAEKRDPNG